MRQSSISYILSKQQIVSSESSVGVHYVSNDREASVTCICGNGPSIPSFVFHNPAHLSCLLLFRTAAFFLHVRFSAALLEKCSFNNFLSPFLRHHHIIHIPSVAAQQFVFYLLRIIVKLSCPAFIYQSSVSIALIHDIQQCHLVIIY